LLAIILIPLTGWIRSDLELSGDEPFFLLLAHSLLFDRDINLENNYIDKHSLNFMNQELMPQKWDDYVNGQLLSRHTALLPLILVPGYMLLGRGGAFLMMNCLAVVFGTVLFTLIHRFTHSVRGAYISTFIILLSAPVIFYTQTIYAEIPGAMFGLLCLMSGGSFLIGRYKVVPMSAIAIILAGWMKMRFIILCLPVLLVGLVLNLKFGKHLIRGMIVFIALCVILAVMNTFFYGSPFVRYQFSDLLSTTFDRMIHGTMAQIWDIQYGVFPLNPMILFAAAGIPLLLGKHYRKKGLLWLSAWGPYFLLVAAYAELIGGICPRGRFLVAWIPLLGVPLGLAIAKYRTNLHRLLFYTLMIPSFSVVLLLLMNPHWQYNRPGGSDMMLESLATAVGIDLLGVFPAFDRSHPGNYTGSFMLSAAALTVVVITFCIYKFFSRNRTVHGSWVFSGAVLVNLGALICLPICSNYYTSKWMDVEDDVFSKQNASVFWEEPFKWDREFSLDQPYTVGISLDKGSQIERTIPLRGRGNQLEIRAKGMVTEGSVPFLGVWHGGKRLGKLRMHSDDFESYYVPWPGKKISVGQPLLFKMLNEDSESSLIIDKIRLTDRKTQYPLHVPPSGDLVPIMFESLEISSVELPDRAIRQGEPFEIDIAFRTNRDDMPYHVILRFKDNNRVIDHEVLLRNPGKEQSRIKLPFSLGTGQFQVMIRVEREGKQLLPGGSNIFRIVDSALLGVIQIRPELADAAETNIKLLERSFPEGNMQIIPNAVHLGSHASLEIPVDELTMARAFVFMSNLTGILQEIPFEEKLATITFIEEDGTESDFPVIIGRHTAEDNYEFPSKAIKLSHTRPEVLSSVRTVVTWPPVLEGIEYPGLTYLAELEFPEPGHIRAVRIDTHDVPGTLNLYAMGLLM